ncbi:MAG: ATP-dependent Clp protease proteolytic subunit [Clostridia bacterium]|nr:ATP-dependent Clp protease proteolytic subunit [Clostridia bacterium]
MEEFYNFTISARQDGDNGELSEDSRQDGGFFAVKAGEYCFYVIMVIGQVEGHYQLPVNTKTTKYEHVIPRLTAAEYDPQIDGVLLILNTVGGDIEAGLAIAELIAGMRKPTASVVIGGGHSIGIPLAAATDRSFIVKTATMTVHPVRMNGLVLGAPQAFDYFRSIQERIIGFVAEHSRVSADRFRELMMYAGELVMDLGTVLDGERAVGEGFADEVGGLDEAIAYLSQRCAEWKKEK